MTPAGSSSRFSGSELCQVCGGTHFDVAATRADGIRVLSCRACRLGVVERLPADDLSALYDADYYSSDQREAGYRDYGYTADHSTAWAAALVEVLHPGRGTVLDIGCADGHLLGLLPGGYRRLGIEMAEAQHEAARGKDVDVLARDVMDPLVSAMGPVIDVVTAVAVFEHVERIRDAVSVALDVLAPGGVLVFEVPVLSEHHDDSEWFRSSLEHVWYPTEQGLEALVGSLGRTLVGAVVEVQGYAPVYVGLVSGDGSRVEELLRLLQRLTGPRPDDLSEAEARARVLLRVLHAADAAPEDVALLAQLGDRDWTPGRVQRVADLWEHAAARARLADAATEELRQLHERKAQVEQELATLHDDLDEYYLATKYLQAQLDGGADALAAREEELDAVYRSTSWRLTTPVRLVGETRRRIRQREGAFGLVDRRRVRTTIELARRGEFDVLLHRARVLLGRTSAPSAPSGPVVELERAPWPGDRPLVSVVIPCFNYGEFLREAVDSVLASTFTRLEVVVVDGGSDDPRTHEALDELERELVDAPVRVVRRQGRHLVGDNRNYGISRARGKYICCLDADDVLAPTYLQLAVFRLECEGYDIVSTAIRIFGQEERVVGVLDRPALEDMLEGNHVTTVGVFRRDDWERAGGYQDTGLGAEHVHEDWRFFQRLVALGARVGNLSGQPLFGYRSHSATSLSNDPSNPHMLEQRERIAQYNSDVIDEHALRRSAERKDQRLRVRGSWADLAPDDRRPGVLLLVPFLLLGGAERMQARAVRALVDAGFRVVVVTTEPTDPRHGDTTDWFTASTPEVHHLPKLLPETAWADFVEHLVETRGIDTVWLAGSRAGYAMLPDLRARHPEVRVVDLLYNTEGHVKDNRRYASLIDAMACEGGAVRKWLLEQGERPDRIVMISNGVDLEQYRPATGRPTDGLVRIGFVGRLSEEKDPHAFLDLALSCPDLPARFELAGVGPLEHRVRARARSPQLRSCVVVHGSVPDVAAFYRSLDLLVLPSRVDGRPNAVLEALASGVPVIASRVGEVADMIEDGVTGWLYRQGDAAALEQLVRHVLSDPQRLRDASDAARRSAEQRFNATLSDAAYVQLFTGLRARDHLG